VVSVSLIILVIAQAAPSPMGASFERAARGALGPGAKIEIVAVDDDPPDEESAARASEATVDGIVELSWSSADHARLHCYLAREGRWVDREITFDTSRSSSTRELTERGRLLGFAVATMFASDEHVVEVAPSQTEARLPPIVVAPPAPADTAARPPSIAPRHQRQRTLEFAGVFSSGIGGTASSVGASAALRLVWLGPLSARFFLSGRAGSIAQAQATTRTALGGVGLAVSVLPPEAPLQLGARLDGFVSNFAASHLSEDDVEADTQSRWLPGAALLAEGGLRFPGDVGLFLGGGLEAVAGSTYIYTHGVRVAVVPRLRFVGELGLRASF
jgi:hypothetical protein